MNRMFRFKLNVQLWFAFIAATALFVIFWATWQVIVQPDLGALWSDQGDVYFTAPNSLLKVGDHIRTIDGLSLLETSFPYFSWQQGDNIQIGIDRDGVEIDLIVPYVNKAPPSILATRLSLIVVALAFWGMGTSVFLFSSSSFQQSLVFFLFCQTLGISLTLGNITVMPWSAHVSLILTSLTVSLAIHLHLVFPVSRVTKPNQKWVYGVYVVSVLFIIVRLLLAFNIVGLISTFSTIYSFMFFIWILIGLVSVLVLLIRSYRKAPSTAVKRQVGLVAISGMAALTPLLTLSILPQILFDKTILSPEVSFIFLIFIPIGYGYAITRYQFIKLERYASRSATAMIIISLLFSFYFGINALLQIIRQENLLVNPLANVIIIMVMVVIYNPLFGYLRNLLDSLLYGGWYNYPSVVEEISHKLERNTDDIEALAVALSRTIQKSMRVYWSCLLWQGRKINHSVTSISGKPDVILNDIHIKSLPTITAYMQARLHPATCKELRYALNGQQLAPEENELLDNRSIRLWVPIQGLQHSIGLLILGPKYGGDVFDNSDMEILDTVSRHASAAFQNVQLINELKVKVRENEQYRKENIRTREEERKRIARELHDQVIQVLVGLKYQIAHLQSSLDLIQKSPKSSQKALNLQGEIGALIQTTRLLCQDLRPDALDLGLIPSIRSLINRFEMRSKVNVELSLEGDRSLLIGEDVALCVFRCTGEALSNIGKHAVAQKAFVNLCIESQKILLTVADNGRGFHIPERLGSLMAQNHFGLVGMRERVELLQGKFNISSTVSHGTCLEISIPLQISIVKEGK